MTTIPDLESYDIIEVSTSGGKDSLAMLWYIAVLAHEKGILDRVVAIHCVMEAVDWPMTPEIARQQAEHIGVRFMSVMRPQGNLLEHVVKNGWWPKPKTQYCTSDHKRGQVWHACTDLADEVRASWPEGTPKRPVRILNCVGLRAEESGKREKREEFYREKKPSSGRKIVDVWLPIKWWTVDQVWAANKASGAPIHPAYSYGFPRASCPFCIFAPREAWQMAGILLPDLLAKYVRVEKQIGHQLSKKVSVAEVAEDLKAGVVPKKIKNWDMGGM